MKKSVWLSYDLGIQGDYDHLYAWLDNHNAVECGNSVAYFEIEVHKDINDADFVALIKNDMEKTITFKPGNRVYIVRRIKDEKRDAYFGQFIIGKRKASPWEGYGEKPETGEDGAQ